MFFEVLQRAIDRLHHGSGCNGGADELIESAAVLAHRPVFGHGHAQAFAFELENPAAFGQFNLVSQPRGFPVAGYPYTSDLTIGAHAHQKVYASVVTVRCDNRQNDRNDLAIFTPAIGFSGCRQLEELRVIDQKGVI